MLAATFLVVLSLVLVEEGAAEMQVQVAPPGTIEPSGVGRLAWAAFDERSGLPANTVVGLALGPDGRLWAGTQEGAAFYDGEGWRALPMPREMGSAYVRSLLPARDGSLWFGTFDGGIAHRTAEGDWRVYDTGSGLPSNRIRALLQPAEEGGSLAGLWVATDRGVAHLRSGRWTVHDTGSGLPSDETDALFEARGSSGTTALLVGTDHGIGRYENGSWSRLDVPSQLVGYRILGLLEDQDGVLWVSSYGAGLAKLEDGEWTVYDVSSGLPSNAAANLAASQSADGSPALWLGVEGGVIRHELGRFELFDRRSGMPGEIVWSLLETPAFLGPEQLWVGSYGGGVFRLSSGGWRSYDQREGLPRGVVLAFAEAKVGESHQLWVGTAEGTLGRLTDDGWIEVELPATFQKMSVTSLLASRGPNGADELWVTSQGGGVGRLSEGRWRVYDQTDGVPHDRVDHVIETRAENGDRELWFATEGGLGRLDASGWTTMTREDGLPVDWTTRLLASRDSAGRRTLWVGTAGGGVARFDGERFELYSREEGLESDAVWSLREVTDEEGVRWLWVGTWGGGASRLRLEDPEARFETFSDTTEPALPSRTVNHIEQDAEGRIYVFTTSGAVRLTPRVPSSASGAPFTAYVFTTEDGLPSNDCQAGAGLVDHLGRMWVGTARGVGMFDAAEEIADRQPKPLLIERAVLTGDDAPLTDGATLRHSERNVRFDFALLSYSRESQTRYQVQLAGFDPEPSDWTTQRSKEYTNLEPGDYELRVWGRDYAHNTSGPVTLAFSIRPAPWRTKWAYGSYLAVVGLLTWGGVRLRLRAITRTNRQLEAKVAERTAELAASEQRARAASRAKSVFLASMSHELRTPLNAVLGFAQIMGRRQARDPEDREHLDLIQRSGEHLLGLIDEVLSLSRIEAGQVELSREPFDLPSMVADVLDLLRPRAAAKGLELCEELTDELPVRVLGDAGKLRQILLNLLGNAVKFTDAGSVTLRVGYARARATFEVEDTGPGIAPSELAQVFEPFVQTASGQRSGRGTGLGLALSRELARRMDGELAATSELGHGSTFRLEVSLPAVAERSEASTGKPQIGMERIVAGQEEQRVLVVDDLGTNRKLLVELLRSAGHVVREASGGEEAVAVWRSWRPRMIFMDRRMPGVDGAEAMRRIRCEAGEGERVVIVAHSASALAHERGEVLEAGFDDFLAKPFRAETLFELMTKHLGVRYELATAEPVGRPGSSETPLPVGSETTVREEETPPDLTQGARVLLVDDDSINRQLARYLLEELGLSVIEAAGGQEALTFIADHDIDAVLLDVEMPGMGGTEVARTIRSNPRTRTLPVLALTAHAGTELRDRLLAAGMSDYLTKPIDPDQLHRTLAQWLA